MHPKVSFLGGDASYEVGSDPQTLAAHRSETRDHKRPSFVWIQRANSQSCHQTASAWRTRSSDFLTAWQVSVGLYDCKRQRGHFLVLPPPFRKRCPLTPQFVRKASMPRVWLLKLGPPSRFSHPLARQPLPTFLKVSSRQMARSRHARCCLVTLLQANLIPLCVWQI